MKSSLRKQLSVFVQRRLQNERRGNKRVVPVHRPHCLIQQSGDDERITALVHNISSTGVAVQAERDYEPDTLLHVLLVNAAHTFSRSMDLNVVRCIRTGDRYLIAGLFTQPLLHEEVAPFLL